MAAATKLICVLLLAILAISMVATQVVAAEEHHHPNNARRLGAGTLNINQCPSQCNRRCGQTRYRKPCLVFCNKCCRKCLCVPPGFYGNKEACGSCYSSWKTKRGGPKCP